MLNQKKLIWFQIDTLIKLSSEKNYKMKSIIADGNFNHYHWFIFVPLPLVRATLGFMSLL